ncbi:MAG TPA: serine/threonine-protein kinase [Burkholderiales bacterium]|jgi:serine/threonine protein kinase|nr:serine/threonine-protein kinase [Burkholderiales bacterium]
MDRIGKYQVIRKLGDGATSEVFLCHDEFASRDVAVKIVYQERLNDPQGGKVFRKLFVTEASLAGKLSHPHIAQIYDAVVGDQISYIVMEYVPGGTLEAFCAPENLLPLDKIVEIIFKCTRALDFAHKLGVTHRDIKPANILIVGGTDIKITDFGSAITTTGDTTQVTGVGSPAYMSPQQIKEQPLDHRTDIYSLGVVMHQLLTGVLPFNAKNNFSMMYQITTVEPPPPSAHRKEVPPQLDAIVKKAMEKDLERRYQNWDELSFELAEVFRSQEIWRRSDEVADSEKFNTLRAMEFFAEFTDAELWEVLRISSWQDAAPGAALIRQGDPGNYFCILASGEVKVTKRNRLLNILNAGECFGEMSYLSRQTNERSADVISLSPSRVITIRVDDLARASDACRHRFDRAFMSILVERLTMANNRLTAV